MENQIKKYRDILVVGGCGLGKSSTGNKIVGLSLAGIITVNEMNFFETSAGSSSCSYTKDYQVISNGITGMRITDVEGLLVGNMKQNISILCKVVQHHIETDITYHRVLYFLPRDLGVEQCSGELRLFKYFYGDDIFKFMVVIATAGPLSDQPFDLAAIKDEFCRAFAAVNVNNAMKCPPVKYLSCTTEPQEIIQMLNDAEVEEEGGLKVNRSHWRIKELIAAIRDSSEVMI